MENFVLVTFILTNLSVIIKLLVLSFLDREKKGADVLELMLSGGMAIWAGVLLFSA